MILLGLMLLGGSCPILWVLSSEGFTVNSREQEKASYIQEYEYNAGLEICRYYLQGLNHGYYFGVRRGEADEYAGSRHLLYQIYDGQKRRLGGTLEEEAGAREYFYSSDLWDGDEKVKTDFTVLICGEDAGNPIRLYDPQLNLAFLFSEWCYVGIYVGILLVLLGLMFHLFGKESKISRIFQRSPMELVLLVGGVIGCLLFSKRGFWQELFWDGQFLFLFLFSLWCLFVLLILVKRIRGNREWYKNTIVYWIYKAGILFHLFLLELLLFCVECILVLHGAITEVLFGALIAEKLVMLLVVGGILHVVSDFRKAASEIASGNLSYQMDKAYHTDFFRDFSRDMNAVSDSVSSAVEEKMSSERMKTELITNVTHDIKTPLTSIINFSDLIVREKSENPKITEYSEHLYKHSVRMKRLIDSLLEVSKAASGNLQVNPVACDLRVLTNQFVGEYSGLLEDKKLELCLRQSEEPMRILADPKLLWRIMENLLSNIQKYSQENTRVFVSTEIVGENVRLSLMNTSKDPINMTPDRLMERFVRGDLSRHTEGNGLGLAIVKSLVELQNARIWLDVDGDLFKVFLEFPLLTEEKTDSPKEESEKEL